MTGSVRTVAAGAAIAALLWSRAGTAQGSVEPDVLKHGSLGRTVATTDWPVSPLGAGLGVESEITVGDRAPSFTLDDAFGQAVRPGDWRGHWVAVVFSGDRNAFAPLTAITAPLGDLDARIVGISDQSIGALRGYASREQVEFALLSDPTGEVSQLYGMFDPGNHAVMPGVVVIDPAGIVRTTAYGGPAPAELLELVRRVETGANALGSVGR
jgi:peroxiredoxin Q/BCP